MKALLYNIDEFSSLLCKVSNNDVNIACDYADGWFYTVAENYYEDVTDKIVYAWLSVELNETVTDIVIDTCKDKVAVICEQK